MQIPQTVTISRNDRVLWRSGSLHAKYYENFADIFDADDLRIAQTQHKGGSHFTEWAVAIALYRRHGYLSLVEKYEFKAHARKQEVLARLGVVIERDKHCQYPDLLVYDRAGNWCFVEVKTMRDNLSENQHRFFLDLEKKHGKKVQLLRLKEI